MHFKIWEKGGRTVVGCRQRQKRRSNWIKNVIQRFKVQSCELFWYNCAESLKPCDRKTFGWSKRQLFGVYISWHPAQCRVSSRSFSSSDSSPSKMNLAHWLLDGAVPSKMLNENDCRNSSEDRCPWFGFGVSEKEHSVLDSMLLATCCCESFRSAPTDRWSLLSPEEKAVDVMQESLIVRLIRVGSRILLTRRLVAPMIPFPPDMDGEEKYRYVVANNRPIEPIVAFPTHDNQKLLDSP